MSRVLMIYHIPEGNASKRISFNRKLFHYRMQGNSGKYDKKTTGVLIEYEKPVRSCVVFDKKFLSQVKNVCSEFDVKNTIYEINRKL